VVECYVLNLATRHDLILGDAYLNARQAVLCYATAKMSVLKGDRKVSVDSVKASAPVTTSSESAANIDSLLLSALQQVKRAIRKSFDYQVSTGFST